MNNFFVSPEHRNRNFRWKRYHFRRDLNCFGYEALSSPIRHRNESSRPTHANQFGRHTVWPGREHGAKHRKHNIERTIAILKLFGISFFKVYFQIFTCSSRSCLLQQVGGDIDTCHQSTRSGGRDGAVASATRNVEEARTGLDLRASYKFLPNLRIVLSDRRNPRPSNSPSFWISIVRNRETLVACSHLGASIQP